MKISYILTDIEGTTTSIHFVHQILFPYFRKNLATLFSEIHLPFVKENLEAVQNTVLQEENRQISEKEAIDMLDFWTKTDRKHTALKNIQGFLWEKAYQNGEIKGHIYPEVPQFLKTWKANGLNLGVYSSGSVAAQKLLFRFSEFGDLSIYFSNYFDTNVGHKRQEMSYQNISQLLQVPSAEILFLSDIEQELDAAQNAGFQTCQLLRPQTEASSKHQTAKDFEEVTKKILV